MQENDIENNFRYPGPRPFHSTFRERRLFFGRDREKVALLQTLLANNLTVLYGPSGSGKTSLVQAGITQELKNRNYIPVDIRYTPTGPDFTSLIYKRIAETAAQNYFYYDQGEEESLWQYFKTMALRGPDNAPLNTFLILDQFEDFLLYTTVQHRKQVFRQLSDLVNNSVPQKVRETLKTGKPLLYNMIPPGVKIIIVIEENVFQTLKEETREYPGLCTACFALPHLSREQAQEAIVKPVALTDDTLESFMFGYSSDTVETILNFISQPEEGEGFTVQDRVEPFLLQLLCRSIEEKARERWESGEMEICIQPEDLGGEKQIKKALQGFYDNQLRRMGYRAQRRLARRICEKGLIKGGKRIRLVKDTIEDKYNPPEELLSALTSTGLVDSGLQGEETYYELGHDNLLPYIKSSTAKNQLRKISVAGALIIFILLLVAIPVRNSHAIKRLRQTRATTFQHIQRGNIHMRRGEYAEAEARFSKAIELGQKSSQIYNTLGIALVKQGKLVEAKEAYRKAIELSPIFTTANANLAEAELIDEDFPSALKQAQSVIEQPKINSDLKMAMHVIIIASLLYQDKLQEAATHLQQFSQFYRELPAKYARVWSYRDINDFKDIKKPLPHEYSELLLKMLDILQDKKENGIKKLEKLDLQVAQVFESKKSPNGKISTNREL